MQNELTAEEVALVRKRLTSAGKTMFAVRRLRANPMVRDAITAMSAANHILSLLEIALTEPAAQAEKAREITGD